MKSAVILGWVLMPLIGLAQLQFHNLNFEDAAVPVVPPLSFGGSVNVEDGIPGWVAYSGGSQYSEVDMIGHNTRDGIVIYGPDWTYETLNGDYSVHLRSAPISTAFRATIAQIGQIPTDANSIVFYFSGRYVQVMFDGQRIPLNLLQTRSRYEVMGGDVSMHAGKTGELRFIAGTDENPVGGGIIDDIRFLRTIGEPKVFIEEVAQGLKLSWPLWATEFDLESSQGDFSKWTKVEAVSTPEDIFSTLTIQPTNSLSFFRLRRR